MIRVRIGELADAHASAVMRPVASDWSAVTPAGRRLELLAGAAVEEQYRRLGELPVGSAAITAAGDLDAEYIVHVVVRSAEQPVTPGVIRMALTNGMRRLAEWGVESAALAPLGTGAGNLDAEQVAELSVPVLIEQLAHAPRLRELEIVVESEYERDAFERALRRVPGPKDDQSSAQPSS